MHFDGASERQAIFFLMLYFTVALHIVGLMFFILMQSRLAMVFWHFDSFEQKVLEKRHATINIKTFIVNVRKNTL